MKEENCSYSYRLWSENCWSISRQDRPCSRQNRTRRVRRRRRKTANIYHRRCSNKIQLTFCLSSEQMHRWFFEKRNVKRELAHRSLRRWTINLFPSSTGTNRYIFSIKSDGMSRQKMIRKKENFCFVFLSKINRRDSRLLTSEFLIILTIRTNCSNIFLILTRSID